MSLWKVILATLVIYTAGLFTGAIAVRLTTDWAKPTRSPRPSLGQLPPPYVMREEFVRRLAEEVRLSPHQKERILKAVRESQERFQELYALIGPEVSEEMQYVREAIRAELTPEQEHRYDEFMRKLQRRKPETGRGDRTRGSGGQIPPGSRGANKGSATPPERTGPVRDGPPPPPAPPAPMPGPGDQPLRRPP